DYYCSAWDISLSAHVF
nr:immunoglobulin light chain junction region [Macaca mulatta]MOW27568.1 immunoglobulin light chain junction region [Macaca mulatta]MOW28759.1 immunoglobulin light chain junction region [Macaca mulatta]MOW28840.1 immunoglobulin light chain junction region [Macaca mulatta]MOW30496.1 immunoglobulin light chain junction region [Macaca mulatta]